MILNRIAFACFIASGIGMLPGCKWGGSGDVEGGAGHVSEGRASSYTMSGDGSVSAITSEEFFVERKEIIPIEDGADTFFVLNRNTIQACSSSKGCDAPQALKHLDGLPAVCRVTDINDALSNDLLHFMICSSTVPAPVEESADGKYKSSKTIAASVPWLLVESFSHGRLFRVRFKVRSNNVSNTQKEVVAAPSKCELIERGEAETRRQCDSGNFNACRDIAGWVANKVMEGCVTGSSSVAQQVREESNQVVAPDAQAQSSAETVNALSGQRQHAGENGVRANGEAAQAQEASVDITSKNMNPPRYPPAAFRARVQGETGLVVDVDVNGNVTNVAVEKSSRNRDLDRAAMDAARKWRFNPAKSSSGVPMAGRVRVPVTFALDGGESSVGVPEEPASSIRFKSIRDAIAELWAHSDYANLREVDFSRIDVARGIAEVDASTQMFLPPGSTDMLVTYYEGNSGLHELIAYRYDGNQWRDISREVLPGYQADASRFRGTNYYLDSAGDTVKVRSLPAKKAWRYSGGRFVQEG